MDNFKAVYKILSTLEKAMDLPEFDMSAIDYKSLGVTKERWSRYVEMMSDAGYIKGARVGTNTIGEIIVNCDNIRITLKGLEYLEQNSLMKRAAEMAKGIKEISSGNLIKVINNIRKGVFLMQ